MINNILHTALIAITNNSDKFDWYTPLTFTAQKAGSTIKLITIGESVIDGLQYRTNINSEWLTYTINTEITLTNVGDYVQFKNTNTELSTSITDYVRFVMTGKIAASGNIQSMLNYSTSCTPNCYFRMFFGCTSLTVAPELPAPNLATGCYDHMFILCESLTVAPELPATTLAPYCYSSMFSGCTSLNYVKVGFTGWTDLDALDATFKWLSDVSSTGTFVCSTRLDRTKRGNDYIPEGWTVETY